MVAYQIQEECDVVNVGLRLGHIMPISAGSFHGVDHPLPSFEPSRAIRTSSTSSEYRKFNPHNTGAIAGIRSLPHYKYLRRKWMFLSLNVSLSSKNAQNASNSADFQWHVCVHQPSIEYVVMVQGQQKLQLRCSIICRPILDIRINETGWPFLGSSHITRFTGTV
jgi:hypothetical protein